MSRPKLLIELAGCPNCDTWDDPKVTNQDNDTVLQCIKCSGIYDLGSWRHKVIEYTKEIRVYSNRKPCKCGPNNQCTNNGITCQKCGGIYENTI